MEWMKLRAPEFEEACKKTGSVCLVPMGCVEKHSEQLPLGVDSFIAEKISTAAAEIEPAVVFPVLHFFENAAAMPHPGSVALRSEVYFPWLENICEEIERNGLRKILIVNTHGGNRHFLQCFMRNTLKSPRSYMLYVVSVISLVSKEFLEQVLDHLEGGHAQEYETSIMLYLFADLVEMKDLPAEPGVSQERLAHLAPAMTPLDWNARFPNHYSGDASCSAAEKGEKLFKETVKNLAHLIGRIKKDQVYDQLLREFNLATFDRHRDSTNASSS